MPFGLILPALARKITCNRLEQENTVKVLLDLCIVPLGVGVSISRHVAACEKVISEAGLKYQLHANGTNIEGDWDAVLDAVRRCHETVHAMGAPRITTSVRINTRTDREQTLEDKIISVEKHLAGD